MAFVISDSCVSCGTCEPECPVGAISLFLDAKQEQLTKLSKLDEFDEEVIRYLIDYVLVYDNEHIEIRWNFDDFQAG